MNSNQTKPQRVSVYYNAPRAVNIGDVFYMIVRGKYQNFHEPCKVCKGAKQITINGVTFRCPCCDSQKETIIIYPYVVHRYRVYKITDSVSNDDWKASTSHAVQFELYRKIGRGHRSPYVFEDSGQVNIRSDGFTFAYNAPYDGSPREKFGIYDNYTLAVSVAEQMTAFEINRLAEYNKEFGTDHVANFKIEHDPKSS